MSPTQPSRHCHQPIRPNSLPRHATIPSFLSLLLAHTGPLISQPSPARRRCHYPSSRAGEWRGGWWRWGRVRRQTRRTSIGGHRDDGRGELCAVHGWHKWILQLELAARARLCSAMLLSRPVTAPALYMGSVNGPRLHNSHDRRLRLRPALLGRREWTSAGGSVSTARQRTRKQATVHGSGDIRLMVSSRTGPRPHDGEPKRLQRPHSLLAGEKK